MPTPTHYQPKHDADSHSWNYTTPTGTVDQIRSEGNAWRLAKANEYQDRETAGSGSGPFAATLKEYFEALEEVEA